MRFSFHQQGIKLTAEDREHLESRLQFALSRFAARVTHVGIYVADTNGPRSGIDKRCRLVTRIRGLEEVIIEDHDHDLLPLFDRVAERLGHTVSRRLERERFGNDRIAFDGTSSRANQQPEA